MKYKLNKFILIPPIIIAFLFLFSSCLPWGPGTSSPGQGGMGGMMGGGGMGQGNTGGGMDNMGPGGMGQGGMGGMMGRNEMEDMMQRMHGGGMMGEGGGMTGHGGPNTVSSRPLTIEQATEAARKYISGQGADLILTEIMEFAQNFYAVVQEKSSSYYATELLINRYSNQVYPEMGPNMIWNIKYGMMSTSPRAEANPLSPQEAISRANEFLSRVFPGSIAGEARAFYGYYTLDILRDGKIEGMLSVHGYTGQVWYHDWHGSFLNIKKLQE